MQRPQSTPEATPSRLLATLLHRITTLILAIITLDMSIGTSIAEQTITKKSVPNIVLILVDDMGYSDLGCYGGEINTPNLDRLAAGGIRFTNFTNCAKCETTRRTLLSGRYEPEVRTRPQSLITIPEALALGGYQNMMVGKWHIFDTPTTRGFDRYFGFLNGASNFFTGESTGGGTHFRLDGEPFEVPKSGFYCTTDFTDYAMRFISERDKEKPFFMYVAYNAPHYPLQAPEEEVMKYRGKYKDGWQKLRHTRLAKMEKLGIVPAGQKLSAFDPSGREWDSLSDEEKDNQELRMETFAAMIDMVDQNVGRIVTRLKDEGVYENTLIIFLSDNGACPFDRTKPETLKNDYKPWDPRSFYCYPKEWANACNTPFLKYKQNQNEGGISTAMIAHWPDGIKSPGRFDRDRAHLVDLHATFRDLAGVEYPETYKGNKIGPARGLSLAKTFKGEQRPIHDELYYTFYGKYSALMQGDWKIVDRKYLYNLKDDRIESNDLSQEQPERLKAMVERWDELNVQFGGKKRRSEQAQPPLSLRAFYLNTSRTILEYIMSLLQSVQIVLSLLYNRSSWFLLLVATLLTGNATVYFPFGINNRMSAFSAEAITNNVQHLESAARPCTEQRDPQSDTTNIGRGFVDTSSGGKQDKQTLDTHGHLSNTFPEYVHVQGYTSSTAKRKPTPPRYRHASQPKDPIENNEPPPPPGSYVIIRISEFDIANVKVDAPAKVMFPSFLYALEPAKVHSICFYPLPTPWHNSRGRFYRAVIELNDVPPGLKENIKVHVFIEEKDQSRCQSLARPSSDR